MIRRRLVAVAAFTAVIAACAAGSPSPLPAQTHADSAYRRSVSVAVDTIAKSVLPSAEKYCALKTAATYMKTACTILKRQLASIARADSAFVAVVTATTIPPAPIAPPRMITDTIAKHDFNDGTFGVFSHADANGGADVVVVNDPTNSGHGKVVAMHYVRLASEAPGQGIDRNRGIGLDYARGVHLGETVVFEGDLYMPSNPALIGVSPERWQRKLLYWQRDPAGDGPTPGHGFFTYIVSSYGFGYSISNVYIPLSGVSDEQRGGGGQFTPDRWQHWKYTVRPNSSLAARDGLVRLALDGVVVYENAQLSVTDPGWTDVDPSKLALRYFLVGDQVNSDQPYNEWRYWDNIVFTVTHPATTSQLRLQVKKP